MSALARRFFSGATLQQALMKAARQHGCEPERLAWREVERRHGFLRAQRGVVIEVDPEAPLRPEGERREIPARPPIPAAPVPPPPEQAHESVAAPAPPPPAEPRERLVAPMPSLPAAEAELSMPEAQPPHPDRVTAGQEAAEILFSLARLRLVARVTEEDEGLRVEIGGPDRERVTAERGRVLFALQHLLPRVLFGLVGEPLPVRVDCGDFHAVHEEELRELALRIAAKVRQRGRPWNLEPMAPHERRIVHLTLAEDPEVETESVGEGYMKRVRVKPRTAQRA